MKTLNEVCRDQARVLQIAEEMQGNLSLPWSTLLQQLEASSSKKQAAHIKEFGIHVKKLQWESISLEEREHLLNFLPELFLAVNPKDPACRAVVGIIQSLPVSLHAAAAERMVTVLGNALSTGVQSDVEGVLHIAAVISAHVENFPVGEECIKRQIVCILKFVADSLAMLTSQIRSQKSAVGQTQTMQQCLFMVKTAMTIIQKSSVVIWEKIEQKNETLLQSLQKLLGLLAEVLKNDTFLADCRSAAGMLFALLCRSMTSGPDLLTAITTRVFSHCDIELSLPPPSTASAADLGKLLTTFDLWGSLPELSRLYLCHGFLVMLDQSDLTRHLDGQQGQTMLMDVLFPEIYQLNESLANSSTSLAAARTLHQWVTVTEEISRGNSSLGLSGSSPVLQKLLLYATNNWDHPLDGIRHQTKAIFEGVMKIHCRSLKGVSPHSDPFIMGTLATLMATSWHTRGKYAPLGCLVGLVGVQPVLELYPQLLFRLLDVMGEHAMATHSCEVIEKLFAQHKRELQSSGDGGQWSSLCWNTAWVIPILDVLSDQSKPRRQKGYIIDYLIPRLLKCNPGSLPFMIHHLSSSRHANATSPASSPTHFPTSCDADTKGDSAMREDGAHTADAGRLGALLSSLKTARSLGLLGEGGSRREEKKKKRKKKMEKGTAEGKEAGGEDKAMGGEDERLWKGLVPVDLLYQALCHTIDQIRIDAIGLLCDSSKTTEGLTEMDLRLLILALPLNLSNPSPSFRQQFISHIKKLLVRVRESGRMLRKQKSLKQDSITEHPSNQIEKYQEFLLWFCEVLFHSLQTGFGYARRATALQCLTAVTNTFPETGDGIFQPSSVWTPGKVNLMIARLADNYESNRTMAFDLLARLSQETLGLQNSSTVCELYATARDLAISNRPYNCETAAYVYRLLMLQTQPCLQTSIPRSTQNPQSSGARLHASSSVEANSLWAIGDLCDALAGQVAVAEESLLEAAVQGPMYGLLHCIRILLVETNFKTIEHRSSWREVLSRVIQLCFDVADAAATVVCNSSPEGFIPAEVDQDAKRKTSAEFQHQNKEDGEQEKKNEKDKEENQESGRIPTQRQTFQVTPQMILVCCWRSMKEVSLLLGELCQRAPLQEEEEEQEIEGLMSSTQMKSVGAFFMKLLKESKHRGAFELAYAGFVKLTERLWSEESSIHTLPQQWLTVMLQEITSNQLMLCATRRSAGLPFAIQALIGPEPKELGKPCFHNTMKQLLALATPSTHQHTARIHALNILRALFKDTRLGPEVLPFIAEGVKAAILGFAAKQWAVRNSATMLFSALISRIFGVNRTRDELARKNCMTGTEFFSRFPLLHSFLLTQFQQAAETDKVSRDGLTVLHPSLYPSLLLLARLFPSPNDDNDSGMSMAPFLPHVIRAGCSAVCKTRSIAATALVSLVPPNQLVRTLLHLIDLLVAAAKQAHQQHNAIHGLLMQVHCLLEKYHKDTTLPVTVLENLTSAVLPKIEELLWLASCMNSSLVTRAAFTAILKDFFVDTNWLLEPVAATSAATTTKETNKGPVEPVSAASRNAVFAAIVKLAKDELQRGVLHSVADTSCPGFHLWLATFASLCLAIRDVLVRQQKQLNFSATVVDQTSKWQQHQEPEDTSPEIGLGEGLHLYLLHSPLYEVRMVALTHLIEIMERSDCEESNHGSGDCTPIRGVPHFASLIEHLMHRMRCEEDHECLAKVCEALSLLLPQAPTTSSPPPPTSSSPTLSSPPTEAVVPHIDPGVCLGWCLRLAEEHHAREKVVAAVVCLAAVFVPMLLDANAQTAEAMDLLHAWTGLMTSCSEPERSPELRLAVARVLDQAATKLLAGFNMSRARLHYSLWDIIVRFLQDEEEEVRCSAARCVLKIAGQLKSSSYHKTSLACLGDDHRGLLGTLDAALTDVDRCETIVKLPCEQQSSHWPVILGLTDGCVAMETTRTMVESFQPVYHILFNDELVKLLWWDLHPCLSLHVAPYLLTRLYLREDPRGCVDVLLSWVKEEARGGAPDEVAEDRLFDRGEANTNYEDSQLRMAAYHQLCSLRKTLQH